MLQPGTTGGAATTSGLERSLYGGDPCEEVKDQLDMNGQGGPPMVTPVGLLQWVQTGMAVMWEEVIQVCTLTADLVHFIKQAVGQDL